MCQSQNSITPRGLTRKQAAAFHGLSVSGFDKGRREGKIPGPTLPGGRYDLQLLQTSMDRLSGIVAENTNSSLLEAWKRTRRRAG